MRIELAENLSLVICRVFRQFDLHPPLAESFNNCLQRRSLNPEASADNKRVIDLFVPLVNLNLQQPAAPTHR